MNAEEQTINTSGGAYVEGSVQTGGDFIGRDKITHEIHYHTVEQPTPVTPYLAPNLPPHHVPREAELAELRRLLLSDEHQVAVTALRGMGGIGKTTLAITVCHDKQILEAFPDGILWATLGPEADLLSAQTAWGMALGADLTALSDAEARATRLRSLLHGQRCLLVIDDVWDANHLPFLQVGGPHCATLVTTRERKVAQKVGVARDLDVFEPTQALALLEQWAGEIADQEKATAGELARRLGYLPLALALAGAQTQDGQTWEGLLTAFRNAQGADITLLDLDDPQARDESLALAFSLSIDRLGEALPEQFAMLGVFAAGREASFELEAAAAVWQTTLTQTQKMLARLVRAALVERVEERYALHLLLGDYARSRLDEAVRQTAEARHRTFYLKLAQHSEQDWQKAEAALPQLRLAWSRVSKGDADSLFLWAEATSSFFNKRGLWNDKIIGLTLALNAAHKLKQRKREAWCKHQLGIVYYSRGKLDEALLQLEQGLAIQREIGDTLGEAITLSDIGRIYDRQGRLSEALELYKVGLSVLRKEGDRGEEAWMLLKLGRIFEQLHDLDNAAQHYQSGREIMREIGDRRGEAYALRYIGHIYEEKTDLDTALTYCQSSLAILQDEGDQAGEAWALDYLGGIYYQRGGLAEALNCYEASLVIWRNVGDQAREAQLLNTIAHIFYDQNELDPALENYQASLTIQHNLNDQVGQAESLRDIGFIYIQMGQLFKAEAQFAKALTLFEVLERPEADEVRQNLEEVRNRLSQGEG